MGLGTSLFLIAVGAILKFAVNVQNENFDIETIGVILMVVGIIGAVLSMIFWSSWGGSGLGGGTTSRRRTVIDDGGAAPVESGYADSSGRRVVREEVRRDEY